MSESPEPKASARRGAPRAEVPPPSGEGAPPAEPAAPLPEAGSSPDPVVQQLLAEREAHVRNLAAYEADPEAGQDEIVAARAAISGIDGRLAEMGYAR